MDVVAAMRPAGDRDLGLVEAESVRGTALDQRQRLHGLHRRAREDMLADISKREKDTAVGIGDSDGAAMPALHPLAAENLEENGIAAHSRGEASPLASSIGTPGSCFEVRITSEVFTLATFGAAVSSWMMKS